MTEPKKKGFWGGLFRSRSNAQGSGKLVCRNSSSHHPPYTKSIHKTCFCRKKNIREGMMMTIRSRADMCLSNWNIRRVHVVGRDVPIHMIPKAKVDKSMYISTNRHP